LIVTPALIVEERRVRRQAGDLGESEEEWKRELTTLVKQARLRVVVRFVTAIWFVCGSENFNKIVLVG
jgi:hypothetical protein